MLIFIGCLKYRVPLHTFIRTVEFHEIFLLVSKNIDNIFKHRNAMYIYFYRQMAGLDFNILKINLYSCSCQVRPVVETGYENLLLVRLLLETRTPSIRKSSVGKIPIPHFLSLITMQPRLGI